MNILQRLMRRMKNADSSEAPMLRPDFMCIGAQKAGTTWLYHVLIQNSGVFLPPIKEIHFFDYLYLPKQREWVDKSFVQDLRKLRHQGAPAAYLNRLKRLSREKDAWYSAVFSHPLAKGRICGEITPAYSFLPTEGIEHVHRINPEMKIIFILRDPVDRALSHVRMIGTQKGWGSVDLSQLEESGLAEGVLARSAYSENISRWELVFSQDQILYLPYSMIRQDPSAVLRQVETFIGVPQQGYSGLSDNVHKTPPVSVGAEVAAFLEERLQVEREFLTRRFGPDFMTGTVNAALSPSRLGA